MDKKIIIAVVISSALALFIGILIPGGDQTQKQILPWQIELTPEGSTRVFGLVLGHSTLLEAEQQWRTIAKVSLFAAPDNPPVIEAYFDKVTLGGLSAQMVLEIDIPAEQLQIMFARGERISTLGSGARKVALTDQDLALVRGSRITSITYVPRTRLQADVIQKRFGEPAQRLEESGSSTTHWLYPDKGLDVAVDDNGHAVLQYVAPAQFSRLQKPLM
ncbi:hypothetical protein [Kaarinaea lacus]